MINASFASFVSSLKENLKSPRILVVLCMMALVIWVNVTPLYAMSDATGYRLNPLLLTFIVDDPVNQLFLMIAALLLFADAPFSNSNQVLVLQRSGRLPWIIGKIAFIVVMSVIYWIAANMIVVLFLMPCATFATNGWGVIVNTLAETNAGSQFDIAIPFDSLTVKSMPPIKAMLLTLVMEVLATVILALFIAVVNLVTSTRAGIGVALFWVLLDLLIVNILPYRAYLFSVASHGRLSIFSVREASMPTISQVTLFDVFAALVLIVAVIALFCKKDISVQSAE